MVDKIRAWHYTHQKCRWGRIRNQLQCRWTCVCSQHARRFLADCNPGRLHVNGRNVDIQLLKNHLQYYTYHCDIVGYICFNDLQCNDIDIPIMLLGWQEKRISEQPAASNLSFNIPNRIRNMRTTYFLLASYLNATIVVKTTTLFVSHIAPPFGHSGSFGPGTIIHMGDCRLGKKPWSSVAICLRWARFCELLCDGWN